MQILALETTTQSGSVVIGVDGVAVQQIELPSGIGNGKTLFPMIQKLLQQSKCKLNETSLICLASGPGSFTNLRMSVTTAKLLAYSLGAEIVALNTLAAIAHRLHPVIAHTDPQTIVAIIDAQRKQLFSSQFRLEHGETVTQSETKIYDRAAWTEALPHGCFVTGSGLQKISEQLTLDRPDIQIVDSQYWQSTAADVLTLGWSKYQAGDVTDVWKLVPSYFRQSAAEEQTQAAKD